MAPPKKTAKSKKNTPCSYVIEILNWQFNYSFSIKENTLKDAFEEITYIECVGKFVRPQKVMGREAKVLIWADRLFTDYLEDPDKPLLSEPMGIGTIDHEGSQLVTTLSVPHDMFHTICSAFGSGKIRFVILNGEPLRYRKAIFHRFYFTTTVNLADDQ